ncbi:MAG: hypothetical protein C0469_18500 [Cyanobacteria bacterium DS2.3.42]|nr:hypothetical protein [Cyanobacteria bacterium DS2.3.42]
MNVDEIIHRMIQTYLGCESYSDTGHVRLVDVAGDDLERPEVKFKTYFKQPRLFRFEWQYRTGDDMDWQDNVIGFDGTTAWERYHDEAAETAEDLDMAIERATGVSIGAVHEVPDMFLEVNNAEENWRRWHKEILLLGQEPIEDELCYCISVGTMRPQDKMIWLSTETFTVKKVKFNSGVGDVMTPYFWMEKEELEANLDSSELEHIESMRDKFDYYIEKTYRSVELNEEISDEIFDVPC